MNTEASLTHELVQPRGHGGLRARGRHGDAVTAAPQPGVLVAVERVAPLAAAHHPDAGLNVAVAMRATSEATASHQVATRHSNGVISEETW
jgi:hypothetical protein